jgi:hypothetical protein
VLTTKTFTGTGISDSPEFTMACASPSVTAKVAFSGNKVYYLSVDAQGPWTVTLTQRC